MFRLVNGLMTDSTEVGRGSDGKLCFGDKERSTVWKDYMTRIMNEENDWGHNVD